MRTIAIELTDYRIHEVNTHWWKQILSLFLKPGRSFEIRHWRAEKEIVEKACAYGTISERDSTDFEVSIKGMLTDAIIQEILHADASCPDEQMTEFFYHQRGWGNFFVSLWKRIICVASIERGM